MYFEEILRDRGGAKEPEIELEFGCSTYYREANLYLIVNGSTVILDRVTSKRLLEAMSAVGRYIGQD